LANVKTARKERERERGCALSTHTIASNFNFATSPSKRALAAQHTVLGCKSGWGG